MTFALLLVVTLATPFEDVQSRFSVDLPPGWVFAPQPGDTGGAYFRRFNEGMLANATVRVMDFGQVVELGTFAARIAAASDQEPGFHLMISESATLAGIPALRRRFVTYINGDTKWSKIVEQRILVVGQRGFVLHAETVADAFGSFEADFTKLFSSFVPAGKSAMAVPSGPSRAASKKFATVRMLVGRWEGGGHALTLSPGGVVIMDGLHGSYRVDGGVLLLMLGSDQRVYEFSMLPDGLHLTGGAFGDGQSFHRAKVPASAAP